MKSLRYVVAMATVLSAFAYSGIAFAADPAPGAACSVANSVVRSGGPENSGVIHEMVCQGGVWVVRLTYAASNFVGIGTTAPGAKLELVEDGGNADMSVQSFSSSGGSTYRGYRSRGTVASPTAVIDGDRLIRVSGDGYDGTSARTGKAYMAMYADENWSPTALGTKMSFYVVPNGTQSTTEAMTIRNTGNVGIGTGSPTQALQVQRESTSASISMRTYDNSTNSYIFFNRARGTVASPAAIQTNDQIMGLDADGYDGSGFVITGGIYMNAHENFSGTARGSRMSFNTTDIGSTSPATRMRIMPDGNVGIGTTNPGTKLDVSGQVKSGFLSHSSLNTNWASGNIQSTSVAAGTLTFTSGSMFDGASYVLILTNTGTFTLSTAGDVTTWRCLPACSSNQIVATGHTILTIIKAGTTGYVSWNAGY